MKYICINNPLENVIQLGLSSKRAETIVIDQNQNDANFLQNGYIQIT